MRECVCHHVWIVLLYLGFRDSCILSDDKVEIFERIIPTFNIVIYQLNIMFCFNI